MHAAGAPNTYENSTTTDTCNNIRVLTPTRTLAAFITYLYFQRKLDTISESNAYLNTVTRVSCDVSSSRSTNDNAEITTNLS